MSLQEVVYKLGKRINQACTKLIFLKIWRFARRFERLTMKQTFFFLNSDTTPDIFSTHQVKITFTH